MASVLKEFFRYIGSGKHFTDDLKSEKTDHFFAPVFILPSLIFRAESPFFGVLSF